MLARPRGRDAHGRQRSSGAPCRLAGTGARRVAGCNEKGPTDLGTALLEKLIDKG